MQFGKAIRILHVGAHVEIVGSELPVGDLGNIRPLAHRKLYRQLFGNGIITGRHEVDLHARIGRLELLAEFRHALHITLVVIRKKERDRSCLGLCDRKAGDRGQYEGADARKQFQHAHPPNEKIFTNRIEAPRLNSISLVLRLDRINVKLFVSAKSHKSPQQSESRFVKIIS
ncbi:hypothetical protein D3C80_1501630 [compost metagenome]